MSDDERLGMAEADFKRTFEEVVLSELEAAHRLARWLLRNEHDAEDAVQEASLRAFRHFRTFAGGNGRAWFLRIVRNVCVDRRPKPVTALTDTFDERLHSGVRPTATPETLLIHTVDASLIGQALDALPDRFREVLVLREVEELSYRELAAAIGVPIGTVMSRLSRARQALLAILLMSGLG